MVTITTTERRTLQKTLDPFLLIGEESHEEFECVESLPENQEIGRDTNQWTRVFTRGEISDNAQAIHLIRPDLVYDEAQRKIPRQIADSDGIVQFAPFLFKGEQASFNLAESQMPMPELIKYGEEATVAKKRFEVDEREGEEPTNV